MSSARSRLALGIAVLGAAAVACAPALAAVSVSGPAKGALPAAFAGVSVETSLLPTWFGSSSCRSPVADVLEMAGNPQLRIGGNSQDRLWPNADLPAGQQQVANAAFFHAVRCVGDTGAKVLLGLNLLGSDPQATGDLLAAAGGLVPAGNLTVAIGNEPDLYGSRLPAPGDYAGYLLLYGDTLNALRARFGTLLPPVAGPDAAAYRWGPETSEFIRQVHPAAADVHLYGLNGCVKGYQPTVSALLGRGASDALVEDLRPVVATAHSVGIQAQISEANSVACSGAAGVSNTPASALWGLRLLGDAAAAGFSRVQMHASNGFYDPFVLQSDGTVRFRPLWTAMLLADRLWPQGSRPLRVAQPSAAALRTFAARRPDGTLGVLAVNTDQTQSRSLTLHTTAHVATVGRMDPDGPLAVTLDGRRLTWSDGGPRWVGHQQVKRVRVHDGRYTVRVPAMSAAWVVFDDTSATPDPGTLTAGGTPAAATASP